MSEDEMLRSRTQQTPGDVTEVHEFLLWQSSRAGLTNGRQAHGAPPTRGSSMDSSKADNGRSLG